MAVTHLVATFNLSRASARALVVGQKILPIIDGLDEMDASDSPRYNFRAGKRWRRSTHTSTAGLKPD